MTRPLFLALVAYFAPAAPLGRADEANHVSAPISAVRVIDGDTLAVNGRVIRLSGIDAPEIGQTCDHNGHPWSCGVTAALDLRKSLTMSRLSGLYCRIERKARYWEEATCSASDKDLAESPRGQGAADTILLVESHYLGVVDRAKTPNSAFGAASTKRPRLMVPTARRPIPILRHQGRQGETGLRFVTPMMFGYDKIEGRAVLRRRRRHDGRLRAPAFRPQRSGESAAPLSKLCEHAVIAPMASRVERGATFPCRASPRDRRRH